MSAAPRSLGRTRHHGQSGGHGQSRGRGPAPPREIEAKFDASLATFRVIERLGEVDGWRVAERRAVRLRDSYWDTPDHRLAQRECTLRVRELDGSPDAELTFKGKPERGARTEETASVRAVSGPRQWQREPAARPILDALGEVVPLSALRQDVVLLNPRRELVLRKGGAEEILSLDEMRIEGHPYVKRYVELELKRGSRAGHDALVQAVADRFQLRESKKGKVQAAREWLARRMSADVTTGQEAPSERAQTPVPGGWSQSVSG